jgi:hypothetical protein
MERPEKRDPISDGRTDHMKDMARRMERWFGLISSFIGRICVAAFLASLSSTPVVENKALNNFLSAIAILACLVLWEEKHRMKALGGLTLAWVIVKVSQWNSPARWHYDIAFLVFLVLVLYLERQSGTSDLVPPEGNAVSRRPTSPSA